VSGSKREGQQEVGHPADEDRDAATVPTERPPPGARIHEPLGSDLLDGQTIRSGDPQENPFAGLLAEARAPSMRKPPAPAAVRPDRERDSPSASPPRVDQEERRVGPYKILEELGSGGMAVVYKAIQPSLDREVAIKELRSEYVHDRQIATRFEREAQSLATLQHGNIVHVYDYLHDRESAYIVMEYVDGIDLFDVLAETERVPPEIAALIGVGVAEGLEYAHYGGIVHRDIKPSNILVSKRGEVKVMDFGIARDPGKSELTQVGLAVGTPAYMAPEQIRGDRIDFRTDIFAFGIVLYEMIAGEKPWKEEEGRSVTVKVLDEPYPPIEQVRRDVPPELVKVISRCLEKNPAARYASTYELRRDLETYLARVLPLDPRGRLVLFLRNRGFITEAQAGSFVDAELLRDASLRRRDEGIPLPPAERLLRPVGIAHAIALGVILLALLLAAFSPFGKELPESRPVMIPEANAARLPAEEPARRTQPDPQDLAPVEEAAKTATPKLGRLSKPAARLAGNEGFVRIVVSPWARVFIDGEFYDYTPFAAPIALAPGEHTIGFRNPYYEAVDRVIIVESGKTQLLKQALVPEREEGDAPNP
jgi:serine/threonine-protein kinase